jgi:hypothetical protein
MIQYLVRVKWGWDVEQSFKHNTERMTLLRTITRATSLSQRRFARGISNIQKPQAYLRPLVNSEGAEEFEGVMCLVMDRKEAKNALSVQMVAVSP